MAHQEALKLLFLVDSKPSLDRRGIPDRTLSAIRLAVLKLLTHFSCSNNNVGGVNDKLRWGYRIFDSTKECQIYKKRAVWLQHTYKNFAEFENHLQEETLQKNGNTLKTVTSKTSRKNHVDRGGAALRTRSSGEVANEATGVPVPGCSGTGTLDDEELENTSSAYSVRYALQDVMNDFQWEEPDMCSPTKSLSSRSRTKSSRRKKQSVSSRHTLGSNSKPFSAISLASITDGRQKHRRKGKIIVLVMECPHTLKSLEEFVGDATKLNCVTALRDTLIAKDFVIKFGDQTSSLLWLDSNLTTSGNATQAHHLLNQMLGQLNGQLISVRWLMSSSNHVTSCLHMIHQASKQNKDKETAEKVHVTPAEEKRDEKPEKKQPVPRSYLPLTSIMDHYLNNGLVSGPTDSNLKMPSDTFMAQLCTQQGDGRANLCVLQMRPMFLQSSDAATDIEESTQSFAIHHFEDADTTPSEKEGDHSCPTKLSNRNTVFSVDTISSLVTGGQSKTQPQLTQQPDLDSFAVTIRGKIKRKQVGLGAFDSSRTYSCIGYTLGENSDGVQAGDAYSNKGKLSQWFMDTMLHLSKQRMALVVGLSSSKSCLSSVGVMEPLTPSMASLRLLHPKSVLPLTTLLASPSLSGEGPGHGNETSAEGTTTPSEELQQFIESSLQKFGQRSSSSRRKERSCERAAASPAMPQPNRAVLEELSVIEPRPHAPFHPSWLEPWHISAPSRNSCDQIVEQLLSIPDDRPSPILKGESEARFGHFLDHVKDLVKGEQGSVEVSTPKPKAAAGGQHTKHVKEATAVRQSPRLKRMKSMPSYVGARTARIIAKSRELQAKPKTPPKDRKQSLVKKKSDPVIISLPDISSEEDLTKHLKLSYEDALTKHSCTLQFTQSTVALVSHFYKTCGQDQGQEESVTKMRTLISDTLLLSQKQLRERYTNHDNDPGVSEVRVRETEMQTLLRLEMEAAAPTDIAAARLEKKKIEEEEDADAESEDEESDLPEALQDMVDEAVRMLNTVPIHATADKLATFLSDILLANYAETIPYMLRAIYEGLMKPLPGELLSPQSDATGALSVRQPPSYRSVSSGGSHATLGSNSNRSRAMVRHPSIVDAGPKRIIGVPARRPQNDKKPTASKKKEKEEDEAKMVRRNLFADEESDGPSLSRRKSVAVMETHSLRRSPRKSVRSGQRVLKTKVVKETPGKKQVLKAMLNKLEMARRRSSSKERVKIDPSAVMVIEESPEKQPTRIIHPDVRRSPRLNSLKRRPSFYRKRQELHNAKVLGARIAGTSPPPVPLKEPARSATKTGKGSQTMQAPATFLLSQITSPISKSPGVRQTPDHKSCDSPSRNTRSKTSSTPAKIVAESPSVSARLPVIDTAVRTTPRAKARRRLNDFLNEGDGQKKASPVSKMSVNQKAPAEYGDSPNRNIRSSLVASPVKFVISSPPLFASPTNSGGDNGATRTTPRAKARRCLNEHLNEGLTKKVTMEKEVPDQGKLFKSPFKSPNRVPPGLSRQSPRLLKKGGLVTASKELNVMKGTVDVKKEQDIDLGNLPPQTQKKPTPKKASSGYKLDDEIAIQKINEDSKDHLTNSGIERTQSEMRDDVKANHKESKASIQVENLDIFNKQQESEEAVTSPDKAEENVEPLWIDKIDARSSSTMPDLDENSLIGIKRKRNSTGDNSESTPLPKQKQARRDVCTPPSVPASKCTTPESINSWPRKKIRYNTPSPCTSKSLTPSNFSPEDKDQPAGRWTSPRTQRQTPPSSKKRGNATGSGKKRKRRSPGLASNEKRRRKTSVALKKNSPKAKGSLLDMLSPKTSLEERCISPVFGKAALTPSDPNNTLNAKDEQNASTGSDIKKRQMPVRRGKSPCAKGSTGSNSSDKSFDALDRSFSPVFGIDGIVDPSSSSQYMENLQSNDQGPIRFEVKSIIDQGLDVDTESDPEIDFPKWKSSEGSCSVGFPSDSEMGMLSDDLAEPSNKDTKDPSPRRQLRRSSRENWHAANTGSQEPPSAEQSVISDIGKGSKENSAESFTPKKKLRKERSSDRQLIGRKASGAKDEEADRIAPQGSLPSKPCLRAAGRKATEDEENTRPAEPSRKRKKKVTLMTRMSSSLSQQAPSPSGLSMTLKRSSAGREWSITNSPEMASIMSFESSLAEGSMSSADDDVFTPGTASTASTPDEASTPPTQSGKPPFVTTPLSATGLYSLMNSPMLASGGRRSPSKSLRNSRSSRSSRRNLPLN